jgi:hypothetical protein
MALAPPPDFQDPNAPPGGFSGSQFPWTGDEIQQVRAFSNAWRTEHGVTKGAPGDLEIAYENLRMQGLSHDDARQGAINVLGWQGDTAAPAEKPAETPPPSTPPPSATPPPSSGTGGFDIPPPAPPPASLPSGGSYGGYAGPPAYVPPTPVFTPPPYTPPPAFEAPAYTPPPAFSYADYAPGQAFNYADYAPGQAFNYADYAPGEKFGYDPYAPTTAADLSADPSYAFRVNEGIQALTNSAAARGVANTGGTLKDFLTYGQNAASQEFQNVDTRRLQDYTTNRANAFGAFQANEAQRSADYTTGRANAFGNWQANDQQRAQDYTLARGNAFGNWQANEAQRQQDYTLGRQGAVDTYNTNYQTQYQDPYKLAYQKATDTYNTNYQTQYVDPYKQAYQASVDEFTPKMTAYQTQAQAGQHESDLNRSYDYQTWLQQYNMWRNNRNDTFDERYRITALQ